jgi:hypothetical protein
MEKIIMLKKTLSILSLVIIAACQIHIPTLSVGELMKDVEKSRPKPSKYNGKELIVRGFTYGGVTMQSAVDDFAGSIGLEEKNGREIISCRFGKKDAAEFSKIKGLQYVTVKGTFDNREPDLKSCTLVNIEPEANYPVEFVDRAAVIPLTKVDPLLLVVEVRKEGAREKLYLNRGEDVGDIYDLTKLMERLKEVFQAREENSVSEREVIIDAPGIQQWRLNLLIESLAEDAKATPILIIKNDS